MPGLFPPFGVNGDGTGNDAEAIQAAINAASANGGGIVLMPPGTFRHTTVLTMRSNVTIQGYGQKESVFMPIGTINGFDCSNASQVAFSDIGINGTNQTNPGSFIKGHGIFGQSVTDLRIENCEIQLCWDSAAFLLLSARLQFVDNHIHNIADNNGPAHAHAGQGINCQGCTQINVHGNDIHNLTRQFAHGVNITNYGNAASTSEISITDNVFDTFGTAAEAGGGFIAVNSHISDVNFRASKIQVSGNVGKGSADSAIWVNGDNVTIDGNVIDTVNAYGIEIQDCSDGVCSNNIISNTDTEGIVLHNAGGGWDLVGIINWSLNGNTIVGCGKAVNFGSSFRAGIQVKNDGAVTPVKAISVANNVIRGCWGQGILFAVIHGDGAISGNVVTNNNVGNGGFGGIEVYGNAAPLNCQGLVISGNRSGNTTGGIQDKGIALRNLADFATITGNDVRGNATTGLALVGTGSTVRNNLGYTPGAQTAPAWAATTVPVTNPFNFDCNVYVTGVTITKVWIGAPSGLVDTGFTQGLFRVPKGQQIRVDYPGAVGTWVWIGE